MSHYVYVPRLDTLPYVGVAVLSHTVCAVNDARNAGNALYVFTYLAMVYACLLYTSVPRSVWTLGHRPKCSPEGMVYLGGGTWVDIYPVSYTHLVKLPESSACKDRAGIRQND